MSADQSDPYHERRRKKRKPLKKRKTNIRWIIRVVLLSFIISMVFSFLSSYALDGASYLFAFLMLFIFILIGVVFDVVGVAVTSAIEKPFHSMAARKVPGAIESLRLIRSAEKVASFCNDIVGDISSIISGATSAVIVSRLVNDFSLTEMLTQLVISGAVAAFTIGGKAAGKAFAMNFSTKIVHITGKIISFFKYLFRQKKNNNGKRS